MSRRNPFDDIERLFDQLGEELEDVGRHLEGSVREDVNVDVLERDSEIEVRADLPGFESDDVDLTVSGRTLTLSADREDETEATADEGRYHRRERRTRSVTRRVKLPTTVQESEATARMEHGVLTVTLPKEMPDADDSTSIDVN